jgi:hypothetical protein
MKSSLMRMEPPTVNDAESSMIAGMLIFKFIYNQFMMLDDDYVSQMRVCVVTSNCNTIKIKLEFRHMRVRCSNFAHVSMIF